MWNILFMFYLCFICVVMYTCTCTYTVFLSMCDCNMVMCSSFFLYPFSSLLCIPLSLSVSVSLPLSVSPSLSSSSRYSQLLSEDTPETLVRLQSVHEVHGLITSSPTPSTGNHNHTLWSLTYLYVHVLFVDTSNNMHTSSCPCVTWIMDYDLKLLFFNTVDTDIRRGRTHLNIEERIRERKKERYTHKPLRLCTVVAMGIIILMLYIGWTVLILLVTL